MGLGLPARQGLGGGGSPTRQGDMKAVTQPTRWCSGGEDCERCASDEDKRGDMRAPAAPVKGERGEAHRKLDGGRREA
jgi:hypothetical protein